MDICVVITVFAMQMCRWLQCRYRQAHTHIFAHTLFHHSEGITRIGSTTPLYGTRHTLQEKGPVGGWGVVYSNYMPLSPSMNMCRLIKLTSPNLNYIIGAGAILLYLGIYVMAIPSTDPTVEKWLCNVSTHLCKGVTHVTYC